MSGRRLSYVEICAGGGGQALGLANAGFDPVKLIDDDADCCNTLRRNRPHWDVEPIDLRCFDPCAHPQLKHVDLLAGGIPCTPYSIAGTQGGAGDERDLFQEPLRLARTLRPRAIMIENAQELLTSTKFAMARELLERELADLGYYVISAILDAQDFGVPQRRRRSIYIAMGPADMSRFRWPIATGPAPTAADVLYESMASRGWPHVAEWAQMANAVAPTIVGGSKKHGGPDLGPDRAKTAWAKMGINGNSLANELPGPDTPFDLNQGRGGRTGLPRLTIGQVAQLQSFPPDWTFAGTKTARYKQVGNAFPPLLASAIGRRIAEALRA